MLQMLAQQQQYQQQQLGLSYPANFTMNPYGFDSYTNNQYGGASPPMAMTAPGASDEKPNPFKNLLPSVGDLDIEKLQQRVKPSHHYDRYHDRDHNNNNNNSGKDKKKRSRPDIPSGGDAPEGLVQLEARRIAFKKNVSNVIVKRLTKYFKQGKIPNKVPAVCMWRVVVQCSCSVTMMLACVRSFIHSLIVITG
jgi:hypothetical protein